MARSQPDPDVSPSEPYRIRGHVDRVSQDGLLFGWCLNEAYTADRPEVTICVDGVAVGRAMASSFRQDLMDAGVGDGRYGFAFTLPIAVIRQQRSCFVTVHHTATGTELGPGIIYRADPIVTFDDRLSQIENDLLLIRERMAVTVSGDGAIAMLFDAVGTFFVRLGQDLREGRASPEGMGLAGRIDAVAASYADIQLPFPASPRFAIFVIANQPLDVLHPLLLTIAAAALLHEADVFLLDDDNDVNAALLPTVVRNLRYIKVDGGLLATVVSMTRVVQHEFLVFVDGGARLAPTALDGLAGTIKQDRHAGIVGAPFVTDHWDEFTALAPQLVDPAVVVLSARAVAEVGGFNAAYDSFDVALADICLRLPQSGWQVDRSAAPAAAAAKMRTPAQDRARQRSLVVLQQQWPEHAAAGGDS